MAQDVEEGENPNIDADTRARAMASVADLGKPVAVPGKGGPVAAPDNLKEISMQAQGRSARTKPAIVTLEQMKKEGFTDLRDYLNAKGNLKRRPDKVNPDMGATSDKAFLDFVKDRNQPAAVPADVPATRSEVKNTPNDLRAKSKEQQARGAKLRGETPGVLGENAAKLEKGFKKSLGVRDYLESNSYAKGGAVSASSQGGSINLSNCKVSTAQKNSSSPKW